MKDQADGVPQVDPEIIVSSNRGDMSMKLDTSPLAFVLGLVLSLMIWSGSVSKPETISVANTTEKSALTAHYHYFKDKWAPLKIFVYNNCVDSKAQEAAVRKFFGDNPPTLWYNQIEEINMRNLISKSRLTVPNPEQADVFYAPFFLSIEAMVQRGAYSRVFEDFYAPALRKAGKWWDRYGGVDHILIQMSPAYTQRAPINHWTQDYFPGMLTMSDITLALCQQYPRQAWHFTQIPHGTNAPLFYEGDVSNRTKSIFFQGAWNTISWRPTGSAVRSRLLPKLRNVPNADSTIVSSSDMDRMRLEANQWVRMQKSHFCIEPEWDSPTYKSLTDSLRSLCMPIVYADEARFPFEGVFVNYEDILVQRPMYDGEKLPDVVGKVTMDVVAKARRRMKEILPLINSRKDGDANAKDTQFWAWAWMQYIQACVVSGCKRRTWLASKYM